MRTYRVEIWFKILTDRNREWTTIQGPRDYQYAVYHHDTFGDWTNPVTFEEIQAPTSGAAIEAAMLLVMLDHPIVDCFYRATTRRVFQDGRKPRKGRIAIEHWTLTDDRFAGSILHQSTKQDRIEDRKRLGDDTWNERPAPGFGLISGKIKT